MRKTCTCPIACLLLGWATRRDGDGGCAISSAGCPPCRRSQAFERFLADHTLPTLLRERTVGYVSRIASHEGIPDYCISRVFSLQRQIRTRPKPAGLDVDSLSQQLWRGPVRDLLSDLLVRARVDGEVVAWHG